MPHYLFCDLETFYDNEVSLKKMTTFEYVAHPRFKVHLGDFNGVILRGDEIADYLRALPEDTYLVSHRVQFDGYVLYKHYGWIAKLYICTASMARGWWSSLPADLKTVAERCFPDDPSMRKGDELEASKGVEHLTGELFDRIAGYCSQDRRLSEAIYHYLMDAGFPPDELRVNDHLLRMSIVPSIVANTELLKASLERDIREQQELLALARDKYIEPWLATQTIAKADLKLPREELHKKCLSSNARFVSLLQHHGIRAPMKISPATGKPTPALAKGDVAFVELMAAHPQHKPLWAARETAKSTGSQSRAQRFLAVAAACDGHLPVPLLVSGAHTHRASGSEGMNMQNLPKGSDLRRALEAPPGYKLVIIDLSAIEARMLAWLSNHELLLRLFSEGADVYSWFASERFGREINKRDHPLERQLGKACILGLGYRMGQGRFAEYMRSGPLGMDPFDITDEEAAETVREYRRINWPVVNYWNLLDEIIPAMSQRGTDWELGPLRFQHNKVWLPNGLPIHYPNIRPTAGQYGVQWVFDGRNGPTSVHGGSLTENVDQALSACVLKWQLLQIANELEARNIEYRTVMQVHDELVFLTREEDAEDVFATGLRWMATAPPWADGLPLAAEGGIADNYSK